MIKILQPLQQKDFHWLFASQIASNSGSFLDYVALIALIVYSWGKGPYILAFFSIIYAFPMIISPFAGALIDRMPIRKAMILSNFITALLTFCILFAPGLVILFIIIFFRASSKMFYSPAEASAIKLIFPDNELVKAKSLMKSVRELSRIFGPIVGGILLLFFEVKMIFVITGTIYLFSAIFLIKFPKKYERLNCEQPHNRQSVIKEIKITLLYFAENFKLKFSFIALSIANFAIYFVDSLVILFAKDVGFGLHSFEYILVVMGIGSVIGSISVSRKKENANLLFVIITGLGILGTGFLLSAISPKIDLFDFHILFFLAWFMVGYGLSYILISYSVVIIKETPQVMMGKMSTFGNISTGIALIIGPLVGAVLAKLFGISMPFLVAGIGLLICFFIFFVIYKYKTHIHKIHNN